MVYLVAALAWTPARADDVTDAVQQALAQYREGRLSAAADGLEVAVGLIRHRRADMLKAALPAPLAGWQVDESLSSAMAGAFYAGGISAQRVYRQGDKMVWVRYVIDSVVLQSARLAFGDAAFATANGGSFAKIGGERALVKYDQKDKSGEVAMLIDNRLLVSVRGVQATLQNLEAYAAAVDLKRLARVP
jgi:hypothetical protein